MKIEPVAEHTADMGDAAGGHHYEDIEVSVKDGVVVVRLNRPERRNAMCLRMREELIQCLLQAEADNAVLAVVITGKGDRAFSAGADLEELQARTTASELERPAELRRDLPRVIETLSKPTIAAINGICVGAGLELVLACTIRIASQSAEFGLPEINLGVTPGSGGSQRLPRIVGLGWAMQIATSGERIDSDQARQIGLVTEVTTSEDLIKRALVLADKLGHKPKLAFVSSRDAVLRSFDMDIATGIEFERKLFALCLGTADKDEAIAAFFEKREPHFSNS